MTNNEFKLEKNKDNTITLSEVQHYNLEEFQKMYNFLVQSLDYKKKQLENINLQKEQTEEQIKNFQERITETEKFAERNGIDLEQNQE